MSIALMITTYGSAPMVHLNLEQASKEGVELLAVHDDCSGDPRLPELAEKYSATLFTAPERKGFPDGDLVGTVKAMRWALDSGADYVMKVSRSFVPFAPMVKQVEYSMVSAGADIAYSACPVFGMSMRTECFAMSADGCKKVVDQVERLLTLRWHGYLENAIYMICSRTNVLSRSMGLSYLTGTSRLDKSASRLWHDISVPAEYATLAKALGLQYGEQDMVRTE